MIVKFQNLKLKLNQKLHQMLKESCKTFIRYVEMDTDDDDGEELEVIVSKKTEKKADQI